MAEPVDIDPTDRDEIGEENLWELITGAGDLIYTYFMRKTRK